MLLANMLVKVIGALFKIPLQHLLLDEAFCCSPLPAGDHQLRCVKPVVCHALAAAAAAAATVTA